MHIRKAIKADAKKIESIYKTAIVKCYFDYTASQILAWTNVKTKDFEDIIEKFEDVFVLEYKDQVIGYMFLRENGLLWHLYVKAGYQKKGVGSYLLEYAECILKNRNFDKIILDSNVNALYFYLKKGYSLLKVYDVKMDNEDVSVCRLEKELH